MMKPPFFAATAEDASVVSPTLRNPTTFAVVMAFVAGAASASILTWWTLSRGRGDDRRSRRRRRPCRDYDDATDDATDEEERNRTSARIPRKRTGRGISTRGRRMLRRRHSSGSWIYSSLEDLMKRIEQQLPKQSRRKMRWPWDKRTPTVSSDEDEERDEDDHDVYDDERDDVYDDDNDDDDDDKDYDRADSGEMPRRRRPSILKDKTGLCIGNIFGLDVGGTLAKLVYFQKRPVGPAIRSPRRRTHSGSIISSFDDYTNNTGGAAAAAAAGDTMTTTPVGFTTAPRRRTSTEDFFHRLPMHFHASSPSLQEDSIHPTNHAPHDSSVLPLLSRPDSEPSDVGEWGAHPTAGSYEPTAVPSSATTTGASSSSDHKKKNPPRSILELSKSRDHEKALEGFYDLARQFENYHSGVKEEGLSYYSRELGGDFHFIRFETRFMQDYVDLIRQNKLHINIKEMGATGGGAHKFASVWESHLGIDMVRQPEMDCLVAGMQFVLSAVVGECYTFRPQDHHQQHNHIWEKPTSKTEQGTQPYHQSGSSDSKEETNPCHFTRSEESSMHNGHKSGTTKKGSHDPAPDDHERRPASTLREGLNGTNPVVNGGERNRRSGNGSERDHEGDRKLADESSSYRGGDDWWWSLKIQRDVIMDKSAFPYLVVSIGTGVSILRVDGPRRHERISGSTIGGGTYWGLIRLLTDVDVFEDAMKLAEKGDPSKVDMMVGDIYGNNSDALEKLGLPANLVASSFGKLVAKANPAQGLKQEDLARAILLMVTNNIGQVAYLNAKLHNTPRIYFVGNFLRGNKISQRRLSFAIDYWSKGEMEALFLEHEGYLGALGAFLLTQGISHDDHFLQSGSKKSSVADDEKPTIRKGAGNSSSSSSSPLGRAGIPTTTKRHR